MSDEEYLIEPGSLIQVWAPTFKGHGGIPGVTRTADDGLNATHVREVLMIAARLGARDVELVTATLLRSHGQPGSAEAVAKWAPHVAKVLRRGRREP